MIWCCQLTEDKGWAAVQHQCSWGRRACQQGLVSWRVVVLVKMLVLGRGIHLSCHRWRCNMQHPLGESSCW